MGTEDRDVRSKGEMMTEEQRLPQSPAKAAWSHCVSLPHRPRELRPATYMACASMCSSVKWGDDVATRLLASHLGWAAAHTVPGLV